MEKVISEENKLRIRRWKGNCPELVGEIYGKMFLITPFYDEYGDIYYSYVDVSEINEEIKNEII